MMSVAGGWFFLMACEMFVLGNRDFRLPGLGSYLQTAANAGDTRAIIWGICVMIGVIVLIDQLIWRADDRLGGEIQIRASGSRRTRRTRRYSTCCERSRASAASSPATTIRTGARARWPVFRAKDRPTSINAPNRMSRAKWIARLIVLAVAAARHRIRVREDDHASRRRSPARELRRHFPRRGRHIPARRTDARARRRSGPFPSAVAIGLHPRLSRHRATDRAGGGFGARHRAFPHHPAHADSRRRRARRSAPSCCCCSARSGTSSST